MPARRPDAVQPSPRPCPAEVRCSAPSTPSPTLSPRSMSSSPVGRSAERSPGCVPRTPDANAGAFWMARSRPTTRWASTTPGAGCTRISTSASEPCSAMTSAFRTVSTARACGSRSTSSGTWALPTSATSKPSASPSSSAGASSVSWPRRRVRPNSRSGWACGWTGTTRPNCVGWATCWPPIRPRGPPARVPMDRSATAWRCLSGGLARVSSAAATSRSATRTTT